jgi:hypothetical protein
MKQYPRAAWHVLSAVLPEHQLLPVADAILIKNRIRIQATRSRLKARIKPDG